MTGARGRRARAALLAGLILLSAVAGSIAVGAVAGQSQTFEKTVTGSPEWVIMKTGNLSAGTLTVEVSVSPAPGGGTELIYREQRTVSSLPDVSLVLNNGGAYENITVTVSGASEQPPIGDGSITGRLVFRPRHTALKTGGDRDFQCGLTARMATAVNSEYTSTDCHYALPGTTTVNQTGLDAQETHLEIYESAATRAGAADNYQAVVNNRLQDSEVVALIHGKTAYVNSLNAGESETAALANATAAIEDFYARMQYNLLQQWTLQVENAMYLHNLAENTTGVSPQNVSIRSLNSDGTEATSTTVYFRNTGSTSVTLQNGTSVTVPTVVARVEDDHSTAHDRNYTIGPEHGTEFDATGASDTNQIFTDPASNWPEYYTNLYGTEVVAPSSNSENLEPINFSEYASQFGEIDNQTASATDQISIVVNQTFDQYQTGEINESDLVDPYVLQNQFSPGSQFEGWAAAVLANLGTNQPTNFSQIGHMNITLADNTTLQGVLHSAGNPASGQFETGQTYDPTNISGSQFLVTDDRIRELEQNFTVGNITTADGEIVRNFTIEQKTYTTTSVDDLKQLYEDLQATRAEIEARESALAGGGGGGFGLGSLSDGQMLVAIAGVALVGYGLTRDQ